MLVCIDDFATFIPVNVFLITYSRPGDHVLWKNEEEQCSVVIQSVNAKERTAEIMLTNDLRQLVSVLELNPHGEYPDSGDTQDSFGVHRGDFVFIHKEGCTNGCKRPLVPA